MRTFGPTSGKRHYCLLSIFSMIVLSIATNPATGFPGNRWGHLDNQLSIVRIGPGSGPASGGTLVTISGTGFTPSASVAFGGVAAAAVMVVSSTQLQAVSPAHAGGTVSIAIMESPHNQSAMLPGGFTYTTSSTSSTSSSGSSGSSSSTGSSSSSTIAVSGASPTQGPTAGGTVVTITGSGFQSGASVAFGASNSTTVTVASSTQINAMSSAGSGTVAIKVTNPDGQSASLPSGFTYDAGLTLSSVSPNTGPVMGGTTVTISGSGFQSGASVSFGGIAATSVKLVSSTQIQAVSPVSPAGTVTIVVTNSDSQGGTLEAAFTYYHTVGLSWSDSSSSVSGYNVYRSSTSGGPYTRLNSNLLSGTSFNDKNVQAGSTYFYVTTAVSSNMESSYSNQAQAVVPSP